MRRLVILVALLGLVACSKKSSPTEPGVPTEPEDITFAGQLDTIWYLARSINPDTMEIYCSYRIAIDGNAYTLDTICQNRTDTLEWRVYLSTNKHFQKRDVIASAAWPPAYLTPQFIINIPSFADTVARVDSVIVFYTKWRDGVKYGPYRNKHRNPPVNKLWFP